MIEDFSVLMSIYNNTSLHHFIECLNSLENQKLRPAELIIVQDGTLKFDLNKILNECTTINFIILYNEINMGLPYSLNLGLQKCKFEIVFRMDADDVCEEDRFYIQYNEMIKDNNLAVLGSNVSLIDSTSNFLTYERKVPLNNNKIRRFMMINSPFNHPTVCFRKTFVLALGGYQNILLYEDWFLWIMLASNKKYTFKNIEKNLLRYRIRSFDDRSGLKIALIEYDFFKKLYTHKYISLGFFIASILFRGTARVLPISVYRIIKHRFDKLSQI
jgi:glycosyltransferase involved in cell wall biosynthesis